MKRIAWMILWLVAIVRIVPGAATIASEHKIRISAIENEQTHAIAEAVLTEAYRRIGYKVEFVPLPGLRALEWANEGVTGGDVARIQGTELKYPNLIPVNVPVIRFEGVAFAKTHIRDIASWEDLRGLRIGIVRGIRYAVIGTEGMEPLKANDMTHLFTLLDRDRIHVAVAVRTAGLIEIKRHFSNSNIRIIGKPLHVSPLYHFLNERYRDLAGRLTSVLTEMTESGDMEQLRKAAFEKLLNE